MRSLLEVFRNPHIRSLTWRRMMTIVLSQVLALGMFIGYLVYHEPFFVRQVATHNAEMMARSFAAGAQTWMFYDDTTRMVALVQSFGEFSTRESAMLLDTEGKILAHNQREKVGSYLPEALKQKLSGQSREVVVLGRDDDLIDIAAPVVKGGSLLGWARLTLKTSEFDRLMLRNMLGNAAWFLLATLIISGLIGWGLAAGLTRDIVAISELSQDVSAGQHQRRLYLDRDDELGQLAEDFNQMLNTLDNQERMLKAHAKALKRSNEELERFAYVASHDLQEPLRMVSSYVQLLERRYKGKLDADADDFIHFAVDGAARMQQLINDLLQFSRVDSRGGEIRPADLNETLDKALFALQISLKEKEATIERVPLPTLPVDAAQITQVWQNLIGNALKFQAEAKPPVIRIGAIEELDRWRFSVSDNGIGIEPGQEERIFQIFQRLHTREAYPGTGIGLSICKRIVERHGGTIGIISVYGEGSEFWFTLPKVAEQKEDIHD